jgi:hypothetical protein
MATELEWAAIAANVYEPSGPNELKVPGWTVDPAEIYQGETRGSGFDAAVYAKDDDSEIVIAFRGTDFTAGPTDWTDANVPAAFGRFSPQVMRAIEFMADVLADPRYQGKPITLTGHSLGGGLASLMAVFFNLDAFVFAPAPFENTALSLRVTDIMPGPLPIYSRIPTDLVETYSNAYVNYQFQRDRPWSTAFLEYADAFARGDGEDQTAIFLERQQRVRGM